MKWQALSTRETKFNAEVTMKRWSPGSKIKETLKDNNCNWWTWKAFIRTILSSASSIPTISWRRSNTIWQRSWKRTWSARSFLVFLRKKSRLTLISLTSKIESKNRNLKWLQKKKTSQKIPEKTMKIRLLTSISEALLKNQNYCIFHFSEKRLIDSFEKRKERSRNTWSSYNVCLVFGRLWMGIYIWIYEKIRESNHLLFQAGREPSWPLSSRNRLIRGTAPRQGYLSTLQEVLWHCGPYSPHYDPLWAHLLHSLSQKVLYVTPIIFRNRRVRCPMCLKLVKQLDTLDRLPINHTIFAHVVEK